MQDEQPSNWQLGNATKQSITEVLHNPRGPSLELPDVSSFDLSSTSLSLTPTPIPQIPQQLNINHFESYLRQYQPLFDTYTNEKEKLSPTKPSLDTIPSTYFQNNYSLIQNKSLNHIQNSQNIISQHPDYQQFQSQLTCYQQTLQQQLKLKIDQQSTQITDALQNVTQLRKLLTDSALVLRQTRQKASKLAPVITKPIQTTNTITTFQNNLQTLREAALRIQLISRAPADVNLLLDTAEYDAAIDTVIRAKQALADKDLVSINALASVRSKLAQSVEKIDTKLRQEFRNALTEDSKDTLQEIIRLVDKIGRLPLLQRYFVTEIKQEIAKEIAQTKSLETIGNSLKHGTKRIVTVINIVGANDSSDIKSEMANAYLEEVKSDLEDLLSNAIDQMLKSKTKVGSNSESESYVVIIPDDEFREETCFDEIKAALKFGEQVQYLENLIIELNTLLQVKKGFNSLKAKISEKQLAFLSTFHKAHTDILTETIQNDRWQEKPFPDAAIKLLTSVVMSDDSAKETKEDDSSNAERPIVGKHEKAISYGSELFKTVSTGIRYIRSMCTYSLLVERSPRFAAEIARRGSDLSRLFNALVGRAILGAEALQWTGLRSITVRHLSLASRTIAMAVTFSDHLTKPFYEALSGNQAEILIPLMKKSEKDLRDHHSRLLAKILSIMMERLEAHESTLRSLPWDKQQEMQRFKIPSPYVATLVKEATVLHKILWTTLPKSQVIDIFNRVCAAYRNHLEDAYGSLDGSKHWIRERVAHDTSYLYKELASLEVCVNSPDTLTPVTALFKRFAKETLESDNTPPKRNRTFVFKPPTDSQQVNGDVKETDETGSNPQSKKEEPPVIDSSNEGTQKQNEDNLNDNRKDDDTSQASQENNQPKTSDNIVEPSNPAEHDEDISRKNDTDVSEESKAVDSPPQENLSEGEVNLSESDGTTVLNNDIKNPDIDINKTNDTTENSSKNLPDDIEPTNGHRSSVEKDPIDALTDASTEKKNPTVTTSGQHPLSNNDVPEGDLLGIESLLNENNET